jgi:hypothetical protein
MVLNDTEVRGRVGARDMILAGPRGIGKTATLLAFWRRLSRGWLRGRESPGCRRECRADAPTGGVLITIDELQVAPAPDLALIAAALQRLNADHPSAVVLFAGSGLQHMPQVLIDAGVTHPDRLFRLQQVPLTLSETDALFAIIEPARAHGVSWDPDAAQLIVAATNGYPAHLQIFADHAWRAAKTGSTIITVAHAQQALETAAAELDERTLGPRRDCPEHRDHHSAGSSLTCLLPHP